MKNWLRKRVLRWLGLETFDVSRLSGQITTVHIAAGAISGDRLAPRSISEDHLSPSLFRPGGRLVPDTPSHVLRYVERTPEGIKIHDTDPSAQS